MSMMKADISLPATQRQVLDLVWHNVQQDAIYSITFNRGQRNQYTVTEISKEGAVELYNQAVMKGVPLPTFEEIEVIDKVVENVWICDVKWRAIGPGGETWTFSTRGAEPYEKALDTLAITNRKAYGKARRNAYLECLPMSLRKAFVQYLTQHTGKQVTNRENEDPEPEESNPSEVPITEPEADNRFTPQDVLTEATQWGLTSKDIPGLLGITLTDWIKKANARGETRDQAVISAIAKVKLVAQQLGHTRKEEGS